MEVKVIAFYLHSYNKKKLELRGNFHISIPSLGIQLRKCPCSMKEAEFFFFLPQGISWEGGEKVHFPSIDFDNKVFKKELIGEMRRVAEEYLAPKLFNMPEKEGFKMKNPMQNKPPFKGPKPKFKPKHSSKPK